MKRKCLTKNTFNTNEFPFREIFGDYIEQIFGNSSLENIHKVVPGQLSVAVATSSGKTVTIPLASNCAVKSVQTTTGSSTSFTVTSKVHVEVFPSLSVTEAVTVVVPTGNELPLAGVYTISPEISPSSGSMAVQPLPAIS